MSALSSTRRSRRGCERQRRGARRRVSRDRRGPGAAAVVAPAGGEQATSSDAPAACFGARDHHRRRRDARRPGQQREREPLSMPSVASRAPSTTERARDRSAQARAMRRLRAAAREGSDVVPDVRGRVHFVGRGFRRSPGHSLPGRTPRSLAREHPHRRCFRTEARRSARAIALHAGLARAPRDARSARYLGANGPPFRARRAGRLGMGALPRRPAGRVSARCGGERHVRRSR